MKIIISRTDKIGDLILTLPMAGAIKAIWPQAQVIFLGNKYTADIMACCSHIDAILLKEDLVSGKQNLSEFRADAILFVFPDIQIARMAFEARIPIRIGTGNRWFHWLYANKRVALSRKNSKLHEAQLNLKLLQGLPNWPKDNYALVQIQDLYGFRAKQMPPESITKLFDNGKKNWIFHPKSYGSAREWPISYYLMLAQLLANKADVQIFISGTAHESQIIHKQIPEIFDLPNVIDLTGQLSLPEFVGCISLAHGLLAASTGPLHIAAALGINALGIYPPKLPIHPGRWAALGHKAHIFCTLPRCRACLDVANCACMAAIAPEQVKQVMIKNN